MMSNKVDGKRLREGVFTSAVISGLTGGITSGAGAHIGQTIGAQSNTIKVVTTTATGVIVGATTGALGVLMENIEQKQKIGKKDFVDFMVSSEC